MTRRIRHTHYVKVQSINGKYKNNIDVIEVINGLRDQGYELLFYQAVSHGAVIEIYIMGEVDKDE